MTTYQKNRKHVKLTLPAKEHLEEIIRLLKGNGQSASETRYVSELLLSQPLPYYAHEQRLAVEVDYCPQCQALLAYHNGKCQTCGAALLHLIAVPKAEFQQLMSMARLALKGVA